METDTLEPSGVDLCRELRFAPSNPYIPMLLSAGPTGASGKWRYMCLSISCIWALKSAFIYIITLNPLRNPHRNYYFQVTGQHTTLEGDINLLRSHSL